MSGKRSASLSPEEKQTPRKRKEDQDDMAITVEQLQRMLKESLNPLEAKMDKCLGKMEHLERVNSELRLEVTNLKLRCDRMEKACQQVESRSRERNLVISVPKNTVSVNDTAAGTLKTLGLDDKKLVKVDVVRSTAKAERQLIIAELASREDVFSCLTSAKKLKGTNIYINKDLSAEDRIIRTATLALRRDILEAFPNETTKLTGKGLKTATKTIELKRSWDPCDSVDSAKKKLNEIWPNLQAIKFVNFLTTKNVNIAISTQQQLHK